MREQEREKLRKVSSERKTMFYDLGSFSSFFLLELRSTNLTLLRTAAPSFQELLLSTQENYPKKSAYPQSPAAASLVIAMTKARQKYLRLFHSKSDTFFSTPFTVLKNIEVC